VVLYSPVPGHYPLGLPVLSKPKRAPITDRVICAISCGFKPFGKFVQEIFPKIRKKFPQPYGICPSAASIKEKQILNRYSNETIRRI
jgi:hypothetical protein